MFQCSSMSLVRPNVSDENAELGRAWSAPVSYSVTGKSVSVAIPFSPFKFWHDVPTLGECALAGQLVFPDGDNDGAAEGHIVFYDSLGEVFSADVSAVSLTSVALEIGLFGSVDPLRAPEPLVMLMEFGADVPFAAGEPVAIPVSR